MMMSKRGPFCGVRGEKVLVRVLPHKRDIIEIEIQYSGDTPSRLREDSGGTHSYAYLRKREARALAVRLAELGGLAKVLDTLDRLDED